MVGRGDVPTVTVLGWHHKPGLSDSQILIFWMALDPGLDVGANGFDFQALGTGPVEGMLGQLTGKASTADGVGHSHAVHGDHIPRPGKFQHTSLTFHHHGKTASIQFELNLVFSHLNLLLLQKYAFGDNRCLESGPVVATENHDRRGRRPRPTIIILNPVFNTKTVSES